MTVHAQDPEVNAISSGTKVSLNMAQMMAIIGSIAMAAMMAVGGLITLIGAVVGGTWAVGNMMNRVEGTLVQHGKEIAELRTQINERDLGIQKLVASDRWTASNMRLWISRAETQLGKDVHLPPVSEIKAEQ